MTRFNPPITPSENAEYIINVSHGDPLTKRIMPTPHIGDIIWISDDYAGEVTEVWHDEKEVFIHPVRVPYTADENAALDAALKAACATFDAQRLNRIDDLRTIETCSMEMSALCSQAGFVTTQAEYIADASAYHLAAALLAGQMAARL